MGQPGWCHNFQRFHLLSWESKGTETMPPPKMVKWGLIFLGGGIPLFNHLGGWHCFCTLRFPWYFRTCTLSIANTKRCVGPCWHQLSDGRHADALASCSKKPLGESGNCGRNKMTSTFHQPGSPKNVTEYRNATQSIPIIQTVLYCLIDRDS